MLVFKVAPGNRRGSASGLVTTAMLAGQVVSPLVLTTWLEASRFQSVFFGAAGVFAAFAVGAAAATLFCLSRKAEA